MRRPCPSGIPVTIFAAFMQTLRFTLQRHLKVTTLSTAGRDLGALPPIPRRGRRDRRRLRAGDRARPCRPPARASGPSSSPARWRRCWAPCASSRSSAVRNFAVGITMMKSEVIPDRVFRPAPVGEAVSPPILFAIGPRLRRRRPPVGSAQGATPRCPGAGGSSNAASGYGPRLGGRLLRHLGGGVYRGRLARAAEGRRFFLRASLTLAAATAGAGGGSSVSDRVARAGGEVGRDALTAGGSRASWGSPPCLAVLGWFTALPFRPRPWSRRWEQDRAGLHLPRLGLLAQGTPPRPIGNRGALPYSSPRSGMIFWRGVAA